MKTAANKQTKAREIKFRAWVPGDKQCVMQSILRLDWHNVYFAELPDYGWLPEDEIVLMQFTGLLDKNGREIYEGDILKPLNTAFAEPYVVEFGVHEFADDAYGEQCMGWSVRMRYGQRPTTRCDAKIIGNLYENPELLNDPASV